MALLDEIAATIKAVADKAGPSVVGVNRHGTGFVVGEDKVVTNAHNLRGPETFVVFEDGRTETATPAGVDIDGDLAVITVSTRDTPAIDWSEAPAPAVLGTPVIALSNPRGRGLRATLGTVSAVGRSFRGPRGRRISGSLEHTAPLARGSSGGPVLDRDGKVVGINTHRLEEGLYLAIPADGALRAKLTSLGQGTVPRHRQLGVAIIPEPAASRIRAAAGLPPADGLLVRGVEEDGPAGKAGVRRGDVIGSVGARRIETLDDLYDALDTDETEIELQLTRATEPITVTVRFEGTSAR